MSWGCCRVASLRSAPHLRDCGILSDLMHVLLLLIHSNLTQNTPTFDLSISKLWENSPSGCPMGSNTCELNRCVYSSSKLSMFLFVEDRPSERSVTGGPSVPWWHRAPEKLVSPVSGRGREERAMSLSQPQNSPIFRSAFLKSATLPFLYSPMLLKWTF